MVILVGVLVSVVGLCFVVVAAPFILAVCAAGFVVSMLATAALGNGIWLALWGRPNKK